MRRSGRCRVESQDYLRTVRAGARDPSIVAGLTTPGPRSESAVDWPLTTLAAGKDAPGAFLSDVHGGYVAGHPFRVSLAGDEVRLPGLVRRRLLLRPRVRVVGLSGRWRRDVRSPWACRRRSATTVVGSDTSRCCGSGRRSSRWPRGTLRDDGVAVVVTDQRGEPLVASLHVDGRGEPRDADGLAGDAPSAGRAAGGQDRGGNLVAAGPVPGLGGRCGQPPDEHRDGARPTVPQQPPASPWASRSWSCCGVLGYAVVTTRRRAREREVVAAQAGRLAALFAASPVGIIEGLPDGTILAVNDALAGMLDYSADELLGVQAGELADPSSTADVAETMGGVLDGSVASYTAERVYRKRSGEPVPVLVSVVVLRGRGRDARPDGRLRGRPHRSA